MGNPLATLDISSFPNTHSYYCAVVRDRKHSKATPSPFKRTAIAEILASRSLFKTLQALQSVKGSEAL